MHDLNYKLEPMDCISKSNASLRYDISTKSCTPTL